MLLKKAIKLKFWSAKTPVLIHTMGKVGSLSVYFSLKKHLPITPIFHTHSLNKEEIKKDVSYCFSNGVYPGSRSPVFLIHKHIINRQKPFKVITLFRDPIDRNISAFFDAFKIYVGVSPELYIGDLENLTQLFFKHLPYKYPLQWYDDYMLKDTGINVYSHSFNPEIGWEIINNNNVKTLLINCYLNDAVKEDLIEEFCGISNFKLSNTNVRSEGNASVLYKDFKNYIKFPEHYLNEVYNSKYALHFFSEEERASAIQKWSK